MQELVVESLVVSLAMVVFYVLVDETTQMPLAERDHACETLLFDRPDEPLGIGVEIGTLRRQPNRLNTGALQDLAKDPRIEGIAVVNQMARPAQTAIDRVGQIAGLLLHPRAARLRVDPGDGHAAGSQLDHEEDEVPPEPRQRQHLDGEQIAGRQALPVRLQERLPGHVPAPLGRRVDSVVVQDPLHRGPGDSVAEVRERAADPRVAPPRIVDRHPDHELGDVLSGHWSTSTSAGAAIVFLGDQSPVPTQDRIRGDDARDLRQDPPAEFVTAHSESTTLGVRQAKRPRAQVFSEDPILLPEIVDQIVLVTVHPASEREDEELQRRRHSLRLLGRLDQHRPSLGRFFAPYEVGKELGEHFDAIPGQLRTDDRVVGPYKCPRPDDVVPLVERLCEWLQEQFRYSSGEQGFSDAVVQAIVTHVYIEWIHPFGDGNGRTGRLLEFYILLRAGNPDIASHILSNFYNETRAEYYRQLDSANKASDLSAFIAYAVQGYRDGLRETLSTIQRSQFEIGWRNLIYDRFASHRYRKKNVFKRRRDLVLNLPLAGC